MSEQSTKVSVVVQGKNTILAYILWWFLGAFGVHRFYLSRVGSGFLQLGLFVIGWITSVFGIGLVFLAAWFIWWAIDAFLVYGWVREHNARLGLDHSSLTFTREGSINDELSQLEKLHALYEKGVLTQEEYEARKAKLLG